MGTTIPLSERDEGTAIDCDAKAHSAMEPSRIHRNRESAIRSGSDLRDTRAGFRGGKLEEHALPVKS